jgi:hypothetical protein
MQVGSMHDMQGWKKKSRFHAYLVSLPRLPWNDRE